MSADPQIRSSWNIKVNSDDGYSVTEILLSSDTVASFVQRVQNKHKRNLGRIRLIGVIIPYHWTAYEVTSLLCLLESDNKNLDEMNNTTFQAGI